MTVPPRSSAYWPISYGVIAGGTLVSIALVVTTANSVGPWVLGVMILGLSTGAVLGVAHHTLTRHADAGHRNSSEPPYWTPSRKYSAATGLVILVALTGWVSLTSSAVLSGMSLAAMVGVVAWLFYVLRPS
jgi:hypothetical protein